MIKREQERVMEYGESKKERGIVRRREKVYVRERERERKKEERERERVCVCVCVFCLQDPFLLKSPLLFLTQTHSEHTKEVKLNSQE